MTWDEIVPISNAVTTTAPHLYRCPLAGRLVLVSGQSSPDLLEGGQGELGTEVRPDLVANTLADDR
jgi:hypothetical protein